MRQTFAISTLGCKVNLYESEAYNELLVEAGYDEVSFSEQADIYIINTCAVTNTAAAKSRQRIAQAKKRNPEAILCVVGCFAQTEEEVLKQQLGVDIIVGNSEKPQLLSFIQNFNKGNIISSVKEARNLEFEYLPVHHFESHTRAFLKIQDGCNQFCSYCIIPLARGNERSLDFDTVVSEARLLVESGHQEIVLTGIHTGRYCDAKGKTLDDVLKELEQIEALKRIRISSIEITEISDTMIALIANSKKIAKHLHIPLQSGVNTILKKMNRPYTTEEFQGKIDKIRNSIPNISISTDIICGFPQESEEEYQETIQFLEACKFSFLHVFPFSVRKGTAAEKMNDQIPANVKKERVTKLLALSNQLRYQYYLSLVGTQVEVLVEKQKNGYLSGYSGEYMEVFFAGDNSQISQIVPVEIVEISAGKCYGIQGSGTK